MSVSVIAQRFASYAVKLDNIAELSGLVLLLCNSFILLCNSFILLCNSFILLCNSFIQIAVKFSEHEKEYNRTKRVENARFKNISDEKKKTERLKCEKEENKRLMLEKKKMSVLRTKNNDVKAVDEEVNGTDTEYSDTKSNKVKKFAEGDEVIYVDREMNSWAARVLKVHTDKQTYYTIVGFLVSIIRDGGRTRVHRRPPLKGIVKQITGDRLYEVSTFKGSRRW